MSPGGSNRHPMRGWRLFGILPSSYRSGPGMVNRDFRDLFAEFNERSVRFLIVGAYALAVHGHVRATQDLDVWVKPDEDNARQVFRALQAYGAPTDELTEDDFAAPGLTFQIGIAPIRIDVLSSI